MTSQATRRRRRLELFYGDVGYPRDLAATTAAFDTGADGDLIHRLVRRAGWPALDLGCGFGRHLSELACRGGVAVGADIVLECCARSAQYAPVVCCDNERLPFGDGTFGVVYSLFTSVGYWTGDLAALLAETARVLRAGGLFALEVAARPTWAQLRVWTEPLPDGSRAVGVQVSLPLPGRSARTVWLFTGPLPRIRRYRLAYSLFGPGPIVSAACAAGLRRRADLERGDQSSPRHTYVFERADA